MGLSQRCVMSPLLFKMLMDGVVGGLTGRVMGRGLGLIAKEVKCPWEVNQLLLLTQWKNSTGLKRNARKKRGKDKSDEE